MTFAEMKKGRKNQDIAQLQKDFNKLKGGTGGFQEDERFWYPERDDNGNGYAVIRFLPQPDGEPAPFVQQYQHRFNAVKGWYIENCPTTIGKPCPVCDANSELVAKDGGNWQSTSDNTKKVVRSRKRNMFYVTNIYVVDDPKNPENNGTVRLFRFGAKIMDKLNLAIEPQFDEDPIIPWDFWDGANFKLKIRKVDGMTNYDLSDFDSPSELLDSDAERKKVYESQHSLQDFLAEDKFKDYDTLKKSFVAKTGSSAPVVSVDTSPEENPFPSNEEDDAPVFNVSLDEESYDESGSASSDEPSLEDFQKMLA